MVADVAPKRVLHVIGAMDRGGAETLVMDLFRHVDRRSIVFDFLVHETRKCDYDDEIIALGGQIFSLPRFNGLNYWLYLSRCRAFFAEHNDYIAVHVHIGSCAALVLRAANEKGLFTVAHSHNTNPPISIPQLGFRFFSYPTRHLADYYLACSLRAGLDRFGIDVVESGRFSVLNNGIEVERYKFKKSARERIRSDLAISESVLAVCHVGRFVEQKNHELLLRAFSKVVKDGNRDVALFLVGRGPLESKIKSISVDLGIDDKVHFLGVRSDIPDLLMGMDLFVFPSLWEGFGIAAIEAQATGLPCLLSPSLPESAFCTEEAVRVDSSTDVDIWAESIEGMLSAEPHDRSSYAAEVEKSGFDISESARFVEKLYMEHEVK